MTKDKQLPARIYSAFIAKDLAKKMIFIGGPRQVGKTTLASTFLSQESNGEAGYLNWDNDEDRRTIQAMSWNKDVDVVVFDEIHKKKGWQTFIKGVFDKWHKVQKIIVTGSARLDIYRKGGDSMLGRYHYYRIHPYSLPELGINSENLKKLMLFGGFPEPLVNEDITEHRRWLNQRISKLVRVDIRDLENLNNLDKVELLADSLPDRVSSPLSIRSIAEDLEVSDKTIKKWVQVLESIYFCFLISPYGAAQIKAVKKTQKIYLWDWSQIADEGARFENLVASHLLKYCHFMTDVHGYKMELRYIREQTGKECDFVVIKDKKPLFAVEAKLSTDSISPNLIYFKSKLKIPMWYQVSLKGENRTIEPDLKVVNFQKFCELTELV